MGMTSVRFPRTKRPPGRHVVSRSETALADAFLPLRAVAGGGRHGGRAELPLEVEDKPEPEDQAPVAAPNARVADHAALLASAVREREPEPHAGREPRLSVGAADGD